MKPLAYFPGRKPGRKHKVIGQAILLRFVCSDFRLPEASLGSESLEELIYGRVV